MRILWLSNPPWAGTGYGEQTGMFVPRLQQLGHDMAVACNWGINGLVAPWRGVTCYPADGHYGNVALGTNAQHHEAELVFALCDAWVLHPAKWPDEVPPVAIWAPVDHYPMPPAVLATLRHDRVRPVAMSRFGERMMRECGLDPLYIPHGVNTNLFRPRPEIRDHVRDEMGVPQDAFLAGMVAANQGSEQVSRKAFPQALAGFSMFAHAHPDAWLYMHTQAKPLGAGAGGIDLDTLAEAVGCPAGRVIFPEQSTWHHGGMPASAVAAIYQAFDVLLMPSMGEGFGIPLLEAQASGVPVITSDHSAMSELGQAGWLVAGEPWWDALQQSFLVVPSIKSIAGALEAAWDARADEGLRAGAVEFAAMYDADRVLDEFWRPALDALAPAALEVAV